MPLINCKSHLEMNWTKNCVMPDIDDDIKFKITNTKLYVPIATLSTKDNVGLIKQLTGGSQKPVCWIDYKTNTESKDSDDSLTRIYLGPSFQGVKRLFFLAFNSTNIDVASDPVNNTNNKRQSQKIFSSKIEYNQSQCIN